MWSELDRVETCACLSGTVRDRLGAAGRVGVGGIVPNWHDGRALAGSTERWSSSIFIEKVHFKVSTTGVHSVAV